MKRNIKIFIVICFFAVMLIFNGCSGKEKGNDLKLGKYISSEDRFSCVALEANNKFVIAFNLTSSYIGIGDFSVVDDMLILNDIGIKKEPKQYRFKINGDSLIFESGDFASKFFVQGEVFKLKQDDK